MTNRESTFSSIWKVSQFISNSNSFKFIIDEQMSYMRQFAEKTYWYLCGIVIFQYIILAARNVGFLPVWTLIEYM